MMAGWRYRRWAALAGALVALLGATWWSTARACSPSFAPEGLEFDDIPDAPIEIHTDDAIGFEVSAGVVSIEESLAALSFTVYDGDVELPGALTTIPGRSYDVWGDTVSNFILVWTPAQALAPQTTYDIHIVVDNEGAFGGYGGAQVDEHVALTTFDGPAPTLAAPALTGFELDVSYVESGSRVCCDTGELDSCGGGPVYCQMDERSPVARVSWDVALSDSLQRATYLRAFAGVDGRADDEIGVLLASHAQLGLGRNFGAGLNADEYCGAIEIVSLKTGEVARGEAVCAPHEQIAAYGPEPAPGFQEYFLDYCVGEPYVEESGEPYESDVAGDGVAQGCSCFTGQSGSRGAGWLLALSLALVASRRRRR